MNWLLIWGDIVLWPLAGHCELFQKQVRLLQHLWQMPSAYSWYSNFIKWWRFSFLPNTTNVVSEHFVWLPSWAPSVNRPLRVLDESPVAVCATSLGSVHPAASSCYEHEKVQPRHASTSSHIFRASQIGSSNFFKWWCFHPDITDPLRLIISFLGIMLQHGVDWWVWFQW